MARLLLIGIMLALGAGALLLFQGMSEQKAASLVGEGPGPKERMDFFVGKATSENVQEQVAEIQDPSLIPQREPCQGSNFECYNNLYTVMVQEDGIEQAFAFLRKEYQENEYAKAQCHQLTHVIGRAAAQKFPSVFEAYGAGDGFCWSGYYHGVMEAVIADIGYVNLESKLNTICSDIAASRQYSFDHYNCVHGLGHGIMAVTQNELFDSLKTCDILSNAWDAASCWSGAFMENIMVDNRNHFTEYLKSEEPLYPCTAVEQKYKATCYLMQTSYILKVNNQDFAETFSWCEKADEGFQNICYQSLGRDASGLTVSNAQRAKDTCLLGEHFQQQSNCVIGAVKDFISYHHGDTEAKAFCSLFEQDLEEVCSKTAAEYVKVL